MICKIAIRPLAQGGSRICHMTEPHWKIIYPSLRLHGLKYLFPVSFISTRDPGWEKLDFSTCGTQRKQNTAACTHLTPDSDRSWLPLHATKWHISEKSTAAALRVSDFWSDEDTEFCLSVTKELNIKWSIKYSTLLEVGTGEGTGRQAYLSPAANKLKDVGFRLSAVALFYHCFKWGGRNSNGGI